MASQHRRGSNLKGRIRIGLQFQQQTSSKGFPELRSGLAEHKSTNTYTVSAKISELADRHTVMQWYPKWIVCMAGCRSIVVLFTSVPVSSNVDARVCPESTLIVSLCCNKTVLKYKLSWPTWECFICRSHVESCTWYAGRFLSSFCPG